MQGRSHNGIVTVLANCTDPAKEAEFNEWYVGMHVLDVTEPGIIGSCTRFHNPAATGGAESPKHLAVYETDREDPAEAWAENRKHTASLKERGRIHPAISSTMVAVWKRLGASAGAEGRRKTSGTLVVMVDVPDPTREDDFNQWYTDVHIPDILETGLYFSATRYVNTGVTPGQPKYLTIYETDREDAIAAAAELRGEMGGLASKGRLFDGVKSRFVSPFAMTYSQADALAASKTASP